MYNEIDECTIIILLAESNFGYSKNNDMKNRKDRKPASRENNPKRAETKKRGGYHAALFRLSADLGAVIDEEEIYQCVVEGLHDTLGYDFVAVFDMIQKRAIEI